MTAATRKSYRIGFLNPWNETAENQAFASLAMAARSIGHELVHVTNSDEIIRAGLDFVIAVASTQAKTTDVPTFGAIHEPRIRFWETEQYFQNLLSYDGYLTISDSLHNFLGAFCAGFGKPAHVGNYYNTPQRQTIRAELPAIISKRILRLCYFGTNWDPRSRPLFRELAKRPYMRIYGPDKSWEYLQGQNFFGSVPFDGQSVQTTYATFGVGLALLSKYHTLDDVISNRLFEIASVGAVAICPDIPWIRKHFADSVYYYQPLAPATVIGSEIDAIMTHIADNPADAVARSEKALAVFNERFAAEVMLQNVCNYYEEWRERRRQESRPPSEYPLIDVIVRVGGRPISTILLAIRSIDTQSAGRFRIIFVRYQPIDLSEIVGALWNRIAEFEIVDRFGGGRAATFTAGLKSVRSEFFAALDDDDFWFTDHIGTMLARMRELPHGRGFVHSGYIEVEESSADEVSKERRRIANLAPAAGDILDIMGRFGMNSFLACSELLKGIDLDGWTLATAEDTVLIGNLIAKADVAFTWQATAGVVVNAHGASDFKATPTRAEDTFEAFLRLGSSLERIQRKFAPTSMTTWARLGTALTRVYEKRTEMLVHNASVLVLEEGVIGTSMHDRDDIERRELPLTRQRLSMAGATRLVERAEGPAVEILPPEQRWAYGAVLLIDTNELFASPQWVVLEFAALKGSFGIGVLNKAGSDFKSRIEAPKAKVPVELWLHIHDAEDISGVVIQNWTHPNSEPALLAKAWIVREKAKT